MTALPLMSRACMTTTLLGSPNIFCCTSEELQTTLDLKTNDWRLLGRHSEYGLLLNRYSDGQSCMVGRAHNPKKFFSATASPNCSITFENFCIKYIVSSKHPPQLPAEPAPFLSLLHPIRFIRRALRPNRLLL